MGLSQTLPVTSYFKMIDIWMLFTMTVPFLEVVCHTSNEVFKKSRAAFPSCLNKRVGVFTLEPAEDQEVAMEAKIGKNILNWIACLMLPFSSFVFATIFWIVGLIASYSDGNSTDQNMAECLAIQPN